MEQLHTGNSDFTESGTTSQQTLGFRSVWARSLRLWYLFILVPAATLFLGYLYLRYDVPSYQVRSVIYIKESPEDQALAEVTTGIPGNFVTDNSINMTNQIEILGSYAIMKSVVDSLDLEIEYFVEGNIRNDELYHPNERSFSVVEYQSQPGGELYDRNYIVRLEKDSNSYTLTVGDDFEIKGKMGQQLLLPYGSLTLERVEGNANNKGEVTFVIHDPVLTARKFSSNLNIAIVNNSELLSLTMSNSVPDRAIDIIQGVIRRYDQMTIAEKNEVATKTTNFVNDRLNYLGQELDEVEAAAESYVINNDIVGGTARELEEYFTRIQENEKSLGDLLNERAAVNQLQLSIEGKTGDSLTYIPYSLTINNLSLAPLIQQYNQLLVEQDKLLVSAGPNNPVLRSVREELAELRNVMASAITKVRTSIEEKMTDLKRNTEDIFQEIRTIPSKERGLMAIERQQEIREQLYLFLLQRREETALSSAAAVSNIRVLEQPMLHISTSFGPLEIYGLALLLGLFLPFGISAAVEVMDNTVKSAEQIKRFTTVPFLGQIMEKKNNEHIVVSKENRSASAEMFRMLRTNLQFLMRGGDDKVLLVTSSVSGEGKTYICCNLGATLAISGNRVLLLGMDLRKPKLASYVNPTQGANQPGVSNYLTGNASLEAIIKPSETVENLYYIGSGAIPPNPAELLMVPRTANMIKELKEQFDYIIIDTPPVGLVADSLLLRDLVDVSIYVTRFGVTKIEQLQIIDDIQRKNKLPNPGLVLNGLKVGIGYGSSYGYGYGYGYGGYYS